MTFALFIIIVFVVVCFKWMVFLLLAIPFRLYYGILKNRQANGREDKNDTSVADPTKNTLYYRLRHLFVRYLNVCMRYFDFQIGKIPSHHIRNFIYRYIWLVDIESKAIIYWGAEIRSPYRLKIGEGSIIGDKVLLDARNNIDIGSNVNFSSNVSIYTEQHDHRDPLFRCNSDASFRVKIDDRAWIGPNVIILPGVHVGEGAVVAAGAVVTKDVSPYAIAAGVPAKTIGLRNKDLRYVFENIYSPFC